VSGTSPGGTDEAATGGSVPHPALARTGVVVTVAGVAPSPSPLEQAPANTTTPTVATASAWRTRGVIGMAASSRGATVHDGTAPSSPPAAARGSARR